MTDRIGKLAIVGASARAAAFSALRAGYEVVTADLFADADLQRVVSATRIDDYPHGLVAWLELAECDAWLYTGALENQADLLTVLGAIKPLLGNHGERLRAVRDPLALQAAAAGAGLSFPETRASGDGLPLDGSWLAKTYRGASGSGVWLLDGVDAQARAQRERAVFQRHVAGESASAAFVVAEAGARLLGITRQIVGKGADHPWRYVGSVGPLECSIEVEIQLATLGEMLWRRFELRGLVGVDLIVADGQVWVIEVNPRCTASVEILERALGVAAIAAHVTACDEEAAGVALGDSLRPLLPAAGRVHGKAILYAPRQAMISPEFFAWAIGESSVETGRCRLADIPAIGEVIPSGRPVLTAFADGDDAAACERGLEAIRAEVVARLYA